MYRSSHPQSNLHYYANALSQLPIRESLQESILDAFAEVDSKHGMRAITFQSTESVLSEQSNTLLSSWRLFREQFPAYAPFSFMPLAEAFLMMFRIATLRFPDLDLEASMRSMFLADMRTFADNPMFKIMWNSCDRDALAYFDILSSNNPIFNFGETWLETLGPGHIHIHHEGYNTFLSSFTIEAYYQGLLDIMSLDGTATLS